MLKNIFGATVFFIATTSQAATITSTVMFTENNTPIGQVIFEDSPQGLLIKPQFKGLPSGLHGFHIHQNANCGDMGKAAGGHLDPKATNSHQGPYGQGHLGDLPVLAVDNKGEANTPLLAPRLKTEDLAGHTIMIHGGGDNYSDTPPLGGGGARIGCGVVGK